MQVVFIVFRAFIVFKAFKAFKVIVEVCAEEGVVEDGMAAIVQIHR
jgi:hypothetical protein